MRDAWDVGWLHHFGGRRTSDGGAASQRANETMSLAGMFWLWALMRKFRSPDRSTVGATVSRNESLFVWGVGVG